jgi:hypothetical protein
LLLAEGHANAETYPVAVVWSEARLVRQREAKRVSDNAVVMQSTIASLFSKDGLKAFKELLEKIDNGE